uniref:Uncharacterized protein n=1 Tax=Rhizophora mucronata TaxID=61149 RepID=A0A2P2QRV4_RHIMU
MSMYASYNMNSYVQMIKIWFLFIRVLLFLMYHATNISKGQFYCSIVLYTDGVVIVSCCNHLLNWIINQLTQCHTALSI